MTDAVAAAMVNGPEFVLTLWTNDRALAQRADDAGVQRIGVDLERVGKHERQRGRPTWVSPHTIADLAGLRPRVARASLFARVNPLHHDSAKEVEMVLEAGAQVLMLPMVSTAEEAATFAGLVGGRALVVLLVEHRDALNRLPELVAVPGVDEVHLGLNDLAISLGLPNRWRVLAGDLVLQAGSIVRGTGRRFGLGGIGRVDDDTLPIPSDLVYAEYARTGATAALMARSFAAADCDLPKEIERVQVRMAEWRTRSRRELDASHAELARRVAGVCDW